MGAVSVLCSCTIGMVFAGAVTGGMTGLVAVTGGCMGSVVPAWAVPLSEAGVAWRVDVDSGVFIPGSDISLVSDLKRSTASGLGVNFLCRTVPIMSEDVKDFGTNPGASVF